MAALSDYLESGLLNHIFRNSDFAKPATIAIALTSGVPKDSDNGSTIPELPTGVLFGSNTVSTNYSRINLGNPSGVGDDVWNTVGIDNTTTYTVYSEEVSHSGYFYPLYLSQSTASSKNTGSTTTTQSYAFSKTFPGVTFYAPTTLQVSGAQADPGYTRYEGNGFIKNKEDLVFNTAFTDWGWVSGVAILDSAVHGSGNLLMYAELENPRNIYTGDNIRFDVNSLEISLS